MDNGWSIGITGTKGVKTCVTAGMGRGTGEVSCLFWDDPETHPVTDAEPRRGRVIGLIRS